MKYLLIISSMLFFACKKQKPIEKPTAGHVIYLQEASAVTQVAVLFKNYNVLVTDQNKVYEGYAVGKRQKVVFCHCASIAGTSGEAFLNSFTDGTDRPCSVNIGMATTNNEQARIAAHEVGHTLGLADETKGSCIMASGAGWCRNCKQEISKILK